MALGPAAPAILKGERAFAVREEATPAPRNRRARAGLDVPAGADDPVFERLRAARKTIAAEAKVPPYVVFHDSVLRAIASARPASLDELAGVPGVGARKLEAYGAAMLAAVAGE